MLSFLQIVKSIAKSLGFNVKKKKRIRTSFQNFKGHRLNTQQRSSSKALKERKLQMIRDGEIETGQMIVPVTYEILHIQEDGQLVWIKYYSWPQMQILQIMCYQSTSTKTYIGSSILLQSRQSGFYCLFSKFHQFFRIWKNGHSKFPFYICWAAWYSNNLLT